MALTRCSRRREASLLAVKYQTARTNTDGCCNHQGIDSKTVCSERKRPEQGTRPRHMSDGLLPLAHCALCRVIERCNGFSCAVRCARLYPDTLLWVSVQPVCVCVCGRNLNKLIRCIRHILAVEKHQRPRSRFVFRMKSQQKVKD